MRLIGVVVASRVKVPQSNSTKCGLHNLLPNFRGFGLARRTGECLGEHLSDSLHSARYYPCPSEPLTIAAFYTFGNDRSLFQKTLPWLARRSEGC